MSEVITYKVNAFTNEGQGGNGAGVVLDADSLTEKQMQQVGSLVGYSETAFVSQTSEADFRFRFFSLIGEVDLCGHATIAACSVLMEQRRLSKSNLRVAVNVGELAIEVQQGGKILMGLAEPTFGEELDAQNIATILGIDKSAITTTGLSPQVVSVGTRQLIVPVSNLEVLNKFQPDLKAMTDFSVSHDTMGMHVFTLTGVPAGADAACRSFDPKDGINEESATGGASGALGYYLSHRTRPKTEYTFMQGLNMPNPSKLYVTIKADGGVQVGGYTFMTGTELYSV